jgi:hypothetical protein
VTRTAPLAAALAALAATACFEPDPTAGDLYACTADTECLEGWFCGVDHFCRLDGTDTRSPACEGLACSPGALCREGACQKIEAAGRPGAPCDSMSTVCDGEGSFCLEPFGTNQGTCSKACQNDADCDAGFRCAGGPPGACVTASARDCRRESDCTDGLTCSVWGGPSPAVAPTLCMSPEPSGSPPATESPQFECGNGLKMDTPDGASVCSAVCAEDADCLAVGFTNAACGAAPMQVITGSGCQTALIASVCVPGGKSAGRACTSSTDCRLDAPDCTRFGTGQAVCAAPCGAESMCAPGFVCSPPAGLSQATRCKAG